MSGKNQRRAARKKKQRSTGRQQSSGHQDSRQERRSEQNDDVNISELIRTGSVLAWGPGHNPVELNRLISQLETLERDGHGTLVLNDAARVLDWAVDEVFLNGWQPSEFIHAMRREMNGKGEVYLAFELVSCHSTRTSARTKAPSDWVRQLDELQVDDGSPSIADVATALRSGPRTDPTAFWKLLLTVTGCVRYLPSMTPLMAVPSEWDAPVVRRPAGHVEPKVLNTIRNLLAKAEATTYAAEAEALSAKAQDLMTRYAIDSAVLESKRHTSLSGEVETRRLLIDNPYPETKVSLLNSVSEVNGARVLWHKEHGLVSNVGMPVDLDLVELLFTSLLVQSSHALTEAGRDRESRRQPPTSTEPHWCRSWPTETMQWVRCSMSSSPRPRTARRQSATRWAGSPGALPPTAPTSPAAGRRSRADLQASRPETFEGLVDVGVNKPGTVDNFLWDRNLSPDRVVDRIDA